jgi:uncharacterized protein with beta-barrel porin domain
MAKLFRDGITQPSLRTALSGISTSHSVDFMRAHVHLLRCTLVAWLVFGFGALPARAQTETWNAGSGSWFVPGNWTPATVPSSATTTTTVGNGGTAQINGAAANAGTNLIIGGNSTVDLQSGGSLTAGTITLGNGSSGTLLLSGSTAVTGPIALNATGTLLSATTGTLASNITGAGAIAVNAGNLTLSGNNASYSGTATLTAGSLTLGSANALGTGGVTFAGNNTALFATTSTTVNGPVTANTVSSATIGATAGNTLSLTGNVTASATTTLHFGSATDTGTVLLQPANLSNLQAAVIDGGTLKVGNFNAVTVLGFAQMTVGSGTTPATLDVNGNGVAANNLTGTSAGTITNSGGATTLNTSNNANSTFAGVIQDGAGGLSLNVRGAGAGTLEVDGSIANSAAVTVNSGGTLIGTGIVDPVTTTIMSGGTLAPGNAANPTGTLTITGNLAFQSGAVYLVQITPTTAANTNVTGSAALAGTVQVVIGPGSYAKHTYDILHATGGLGGTTFAGVSFSAPNFSGSLTTDATDVFLNLTTATLGAGTPLNPNQQAIAGAINGVFNGGGTPPANVVGIFNLTGTSLTNALTQLDGEVATGAEHAAFQLTDEFLSLMLDPFVGGRGAVAGGGGPALGFAPEAQANLPPELALAYASVFTKAPPATAFEQRWSAWGSAYGGGSTTNGNSAAGSNTLTANTYGFAGGIDYRLSPTTVVGVALAGAGTNWGLANALGTGRSDAVQAGAYGVSWFGPTYLAGALSFSNHWFSTNRTALGDVLTAKFEGQSYGARLEGGYRYAVQPAFAVTPYAALQLQDFRTPAYTELDASGGAVGLAYNAVNATDVRSELGARFDDRTLLGGKPLILFGRLAWAHDFVGNPSLSAAFQALPGAAFTVNGAPIPHDSAISTAGAQLYLAPQWTFIAKFDGEFAGGSQTYAGSGTLRHTW